VKVNIRNGRVTGNYTVFAGGEEVNVPFKSTIGINHLKQPSCNINPYGTSIISCIQRLVIIISICNFINIIFLHRATNRIIGYEGHTHLLLQLEWFT
jgi:hypothetical protein